MSRKNIALIGPIHPYRGGIAQYTEALADSLERQTNVSVFSFKRLYPRFLYPGKSDKVPNQAEDKKRDVNYILDTVSPLSWYRAVQSIKNSGCDTVIITWWTLFCQPALSFIAWRLRKKGLYVIFLCHNVADHGSNGLKQYLSSVMLKTANAYIVHSHEEAAKIQDTKPTAKILERPHPIYTHFPKPAKKLKQRGRLELLYFGLIRPYKGVSVLVDSMKILDDSNVYLTIVGEVWGKNNKQKLINQIKKIKANIEPVFSYVSDGEAADYFARADVVVLPYLSATGSGVVALAYNYGKPVVASSIGGLPAVVTDQETGWLMSPDKSSELAQILKHMTREKAKSMRPAINKFCAENSWDNMTTAIVDFSNKK